MGGEAEQEGRRTATEADRQADRQTDRQTDEKRDIAEGEWCGSSVQWVVGDSGESGGVPADRDRSKLQGVCLPSTSSGAAAPIGFQGSEGWPPQGSPPHGWPLQGGQEESGVKGCGVSEEEQRTQVVQSYSKSLRVNIPPLAAGEEGQP